ncbi:sulfur carrier protein ThiS [Acidobacteriota bacterium]
MNKKITVNTQLIDWEENMTVDRILKIMNYTFRMIVVKVNGELVRKEEYKTRIIPEDADVQVIHLISGG